MVSVASTAGPTSPQLDPRSLQHGHEVEQATQRQAVHTQEAKGRRDTGSDLAHPVEHSVPDPGKDASGKESRKGRDLRCGAS